MLKGAFVEWLKYCLGAGLVCLFSKSCLVFHVDFVSHKFVFMNVEILFKLYKSTFVMKELK